MMERYEEYLEEIGNYMSSPVFSIDGEFSVQEAAQEMHNRGVGALFVSEMGEPVGIITETDITRKVVGGGLNPEQTKVCQVMTQPILSMDRYISVEEAEEFMKKNKIRHLAVTEEDRIVGVLSVKDLVACYAKSFRTME